MSDQVLTERMMALFGDQREAFCRINRPCGVKYVIGPQRHALVARVSREIDAGPDQLLANAQPARLGGEQHHAQLGNCIILLDHKSTAKTLP